MLSYNDRDLSLSGTNNSMLDLFICIIRIIGMSLVYWYRVLENKIEHY